MYAAQVDLVSVTDDQNKIIYLFSEGLKVDRRLFLELGKMKPSDIVLRHFYTEIRRRSNHFSQKGYAIVFKHQRKKVLLIFPNR